MRKILFFLFAGLFICGLALANSDYTYENVTILGSGMGGTGQVPPVEVIRVTIGSDDDTVTTGMVMAWGIEPQYTDGNALGLVVSKCGRSMSEDVSTSTVRKGPYAGVMITTCTSIDPSNPAVGSWGGNSNPTHPSYGMGFMAIRGFVDAYVDVSEANVGGPLVIHGNGAIGKGGVAGYFATHDAMKNNNAITGAAILSQDIGILLEKKSADGLMKVWLR